MVRKNSRKTKKKTLDNVNSILRKLKWKYRKDFDNKPFNEYSNLLYLNILTFREY